MHAVMPSLPPVSPSPLAVAVAAYAVVAVAVALGVRHRGRRYHADPESDSETARRLRRLRHWGALYGWLLTALITTQFGVARAARAWLGETLGVPGVAPVVGTLAAYLLPAVLVAVAVRLATVPYRRAVRDLPLRYRDVAAWELERDGVGLAVVLGGAAIIAIAPPGWGRVLTAVSLGFVATALTPLALVVALRTRLPTKGERARVGDALPDGTNLRIVDDRTRLGCAAAAGVVPGLRYVFLTESLFDLLDDAQLRAVAAHEVGHHEHEHVLLRFGTVAAAAGAGLGLAEFAPAVALAAMAVGAVPFALLSAWVIRRTEREADAYAARTVGGPALASALETLAEYRLVLDATGPIDALSYHPPLPERIETLRGRAERPEATA